MKQTYKIIKNKVTPFFVQVRSWNVAKSNLFLNHEFFHFLIVRNIHRKYKMKKWRRFDKKNQN